MFRDFLTFDKYLTPSIIRIFYLLQLALIGLATLSGALTALSVLFLHSFIGGLFLLAAVLLGAALGVMGARIVTEVVMVFFQNNEHLAAIRAHTQR